MNLRKAEPYSDADCSRGTEEQLCRDRPASWGQWSEKLCALESEEASDTLGCMNKNVVQKLGEVIILCFSCVELFPDIWVWSPTI